VRIDRRPQGESANWQLPRGRLTRSSRSSSSSCQIRLLLRRRFLTPAVDGTSAAQRVIPTGNDKVMEVPKREFAEAVDRVSTISSEEVAGG